VKGFFIVFEGIEGAGKSTLMQRLSQELKKKGIPFKTTREPGGPHTAEVIREVILKKDLPIEPMTELFLLMASRYENTVKVIIPALEEGYIVISDRYRDSSVAYQGYGRGIPLDFIEELNEKATLGLKPDIVFIIDISVEEMIRRIEGRGGERNRMDSQEMDFYRKARMGYLLMAREDPDRYVVLDGTMSEDELIGKIMDIMRQKMKEKGVSYAL